MTGFISATLLSSISSRIADTSSEMRPKAPPHKAVWPEGITDSRVHNIWHLVTPDNKAVLIQRISSPLGAPGGWKTHPNSLPQRILLFWVFMGKIVCELNRTKCTRVGTLIVATIYLQLIQSRCMFRSFTVFQCSHQHCVQPVASDVEVVGYL